MKRSVAASALAVLGLGIDECNVLKGKIGPNETIKDSPRGKIAPSTPSIELRTSSLRTSGVTTGQPTFGGNLFNGYARGRDSVDVSDLRLKRTRLSQTGFMAGWPAMGCLWHGFLLKGAY